ncbi:hypothetical protein C2G38_2310118 [Gigaspora rosea]|uniref:Uncharacterized protein n=1 Tax=Gigaspora rosea TaxID=44941 RepID=A0A397V7X9_9GLOM|nr:hypothetical protein C2G38_2310118 [Gigaspora rosea]
MRTKSHTKLTSFQLDAQFHHLCHLKEVLHSDRQRHIAKTVSLLLAKTIIVLSATPSHQNYHCHSATLPHQNYHRYSITLPRNSRQINRNYRDIESHSHRSISPNERFHSHHRSRSPDERDKGVSFLKSTVESLINEVNKLKSDKATTSNDLSEYVDVDDTETTGVMGTTGLSCPMDNMGFCDLDADETTVTPCDANETTIAPCDNTNSAIATSLVNSSNKKGKQSKDHNIPANNLKKLSVTPEPPSEYMKKSREYLEEITADQYKLFHVYKYFIIKYYFIY